MVVMHWKWQKFNDISGFEMHEILSVRQRVFIVEQQCIYLDADGLDKYSYHLTGRSEEGELRVYARVTYPGKRFEEPSIGRILAVMDFRGKGHARKAVQLAIKKIKKEFPGQNIKISAQMYLLNFYSSLGFCQISESYDEDGIEHVDMILEQQ